MDANDAGQARQQERAGRRWLVATIAGTVGILVVSLALACMPGRHRHGWRNHGELTPERIEEFKAHAELGLRRALRCDRAHPPRYFGTRRTDRRTSAREPA